MISKLKLYIEFWKEALKGWRIVYKVCHVREGEMVSAIVLYPAAMAFYQLNKISIPPDDIPNSKLFSFSNLRDALRFSRNVSDSIVLACLAKIDHSVSFSKAKWNGSPLTFAGFWDGNYSYMPKSPPQGTIFCDQILPIRVVKKPLLK